MDPSQKVTRHEDYKYEPKVLDLYQVIGSVCGVGGLMVGNVAAKMPFNYGAATRLPVFILAGIGVGTVAAYFRDQVSKRKMIRAEDYIAAHPNEFTTAAPKQYKDVLMPWHPVR